VSLSAHDYVGHGWGHESQEMWDMTLRLDAALAQFLAALDAKAGAGNWAMIVTSDHGASPSPARAHPPGGVVTFADVKDAAQRTAVAELGAGDWVADAKYPTIYFTKAFLAQPDKERAIATRKVMLALRSIPGIGRVEKAADFEGDCAHRTDADARAICYTLDPERSGDLVWLPAANWVVAEAGDPTTTAHGSLHDYDRRVPLIVLAPGRRAHAPLAHPDATLVPMTTISAMLAHWLGVTPPQELR
jgi:arylsulfatase A-like enzyme